MRNEFSCKSISEEITENAESAERMSLQDIMMIQMKYHNQKHKFQIYVIENKILLIMKNLQTVRFSKKLDN